MPGAGRWIGVLARFVIAVCNLVAYVDCDLCGAGVGSVYIFCCCECREERRNERGGPTFVVDKMVGVVGPAGGKRRRRKKGEWAEDVFGVSE